MNDEPRPKYYVQSRSLRGNKWAVMKTGEKRALRLFKEVDIAVDYCQSLIEPIPMNHWLIKIYAVDGRLVRQSIKWSEP